MDALGAAEAVLALGVLPGGLVLWLASWLAARTAGRSGAWSLRLPEVSALLLLDLAVAQAPIAESPIASLPPGQGAAPDIAVVALLVGAAVAVATPRSRPGWNWAMAGALTAAVLAMAFGAASLSLPGITGHPGASMLAARVAATTALLLATPALTAGCRLSSAGEATLVTGLAILALALLNPTGLGSWQAALATALTVVVATAYAAAVLRWRADLARFHAGSGIACVVAVTANLAAVLVGVRA